jgi:hypothetical protein
VLFARLTVGTAFAPLKLIPLTAAAVRLVAVNAPAPVMPAPVLRCTTGAFAGFTAALTVTVPLFAFPICRIPVVVIVANSALESSTVLAAASVPLPRSNATPLVLCKRLTVALPPLTVPPPSAILSAVRLTAFALAPLVMLPLELSVPVPAVIVTPPGPLIVRPLFVSPTALIVTVLAELVIFPVATVIAAEFTRFTTPPVAFTFASASTPVLLTQMSPALELEPSRLVAAVTIGVPEAPTLVALVVPRFTVAPVTVPAVRVIVPSAFRLTVPVTPGAVMFPPITRFPPLASTRSVPLFASLSKNPATPTVVVTAVVCRNSAPLVVLVADSATPTVPTTTGDAGSAPIPVAALSVRFPAVALSVPALLVIAPVAAPPPLAVTVNVVLAVKFAPIAIPPVWFTIDTVPAPLGFPAAVILIWPVCVVLPIVSPPPAVIVLSSPLVSPRLPGVFVPISVARLAV